MNYFNSLLNNYHRLILQGSQNLIRFTLLCQNLWKKYNDATRYNLFRNDLFYDIITPIAKVSKRRSLESRAQILPGLAHHYHHMMSVHILHRVFICLFILKIFGILDSGFFPSLDVERLLVSDIFSSLYCFSQCYSGITV